MQRFVLLQVITPHYHHDVALKNMKELKQLVDTYGGIVIEKSIQHRVKPHPATYIGSGKVEWLKKIVKEKKIDVVVINAIANSGQLFRLTKTLWEVNKKIMVWDRVDLILNIFDQHATTTEAKLQIELAKIQHTGPQIYGLGKTELSRQAGGIGTRGIGETNIERERRVIKKRTQEIKQKLKKLTDNQRHKILQRKQKGINTVALVGYTSAGKTTLFNALTSKKKHAHQGLFTTLDSVVGKLKIAPHDPTVLISDTIGFIDDLPPLLIDAFRSTLMESLEARVLLHVIDAADEDMVKKIQVVEKILAELDVKQKPIMVFNKSERLHEKEYANIAKRYAHHHCLFISAKYNQGLDILKQLIAEEFLK